MPDGHDLPVLATGADVFRCEDDAVTLSTLGRYELREVVGVGGFATVYRGYDPNLDATVAIKVLADNWSHDPDVRRRFRQEAVLLRRARRDGDVPGIVTVHDIDESPDGRPYLVMTWADRGTLAARCDETSWTVADVVPVVETLASTLESIHRAGIVHRDLKPSNLLLRSDHDARSDGALVRAGERLLVGDLGLAKDLTDDHTAFSLAGGTGGYMAPEQHDPATPVDRRADLFAATRIIEELLDGATDEPTSTRAESVLARGRAVDPSVRFASASEWGGALVDALVEPASAGVRAAGESAPTPSTSRRWAAFLVALLMLVVGGIALLNATGGDDERVQGPDTVTVGESARFRADVEDPDSIVWTDWNGDEIASADLEVTALLPGRLDFSLQADGERTDHAVQVVGSPLDPAIDGPTTVAAGDVAEYGAVLGSEVVSHYWIDPSGNRRDDERLRLLFPASGSFEIVVVAVDTAGSQRGARQIVEVP